MTARAYLGIDVGTGSARAALFDAEGTRLGMGVCPTKTWHPETDHVEQSSEDIWWACGEAVRGALDESGVDPGDVAGIGFDATCSLVAVDAAGAPVSVSTTGNDAQNVVVWMDHRAIPQAERINATGHAVLRYVGGVISPEMETPKLLWLKEHLPRCWERAGRFFDLPDWLVFRATGQDVRSLCSLVCKWTYLGHEERWDEGFFRRIGLGDLADDGFARIGTRIRPMGERAGALTEDAACSLGLVPGIPVAVSIIDAHAGGVGMLGASDGALDARLALISGTSSCHMAVSKEPRYIGGVWGPYWSAMVPGTWLNEGGQSATGALLDHVVRSHARGAELAEEAKTAGTNVFAVLNAHLERLAESRGAAFPAELTREVHVLPYFHGNRSPRADPTLRGAITGLTLDDGADALAVQYLATVQAIAYGTRHILEAMNAEGYAIETLVACGGDTKNPVFLREHADATGCRIVIPREPEAVLLGSAILGAVAAGDRPDIPDAMGAMTSADRVIEPAAGAVRRFHDRKYSVFQRMYDDQLAYRAAMS